MPLSRFGTLLRELATLRGSLRWSVKALTWVESVSKRVLRSILKRLCLTCEFVEEFVGVRLGVAPFHAGGGGAVPHDECAHGLA